MTDEEVIECYPRLKRPLHESVHDDIKKMTAMYIPEEIHDDTKIVHPLDCFTKPGRIPHIWCPGCGLGIVLTAYIRACQEACQEMDWEWDKFVVVSGIGCTGRIAGYLNQDTYHTTHGRPIPFATGLKLANPDLHVTVISGDGDLFAIGGNHLIHAARRNVNINVICVNNFNYGMTGGQVAPTTPKLARTSTSPYGCIEHAFNLPGLVAGAGASYVARWTTIHPRQIKDSIIDMFHTMGFTFTEIISPCPTGYGRPNKFGSGLEEMKMLMESSVVRHGYDPAKAGIDLGGPIVCGKFTETRKQTYLEAFIELGNRVRKIKEMEKAKNK